MVASAAKKRVVIKRPATKEKKTPVKKRSLRRDVKKMSRSVKAEILQ
jgi:hypothetical protein